MIQNLALAYLLIINAVTFFVYWSDKNAAQHKRWRTSEATLLLLSAVGGAFGGLLAMNLFRHKTRKALFWVVNVVACVFYFLVILRSLSLL